MNYLMNYLRAFFFFLAFGFWEIELKIIWSTLKISFASLFIAYRSTTGQCHLRPSPRQQNKPHLDTLGALLNQPCRTDPVVVTPLILLMVPTPTPNRNEIHQPVPKDIHHHPQKVAEREVPKKIPRQKVANDAVTLKERKNNSKGDEEVVETMDTVDIDQNHPAMACRPK